MLDNPTPYAGTFQQLADARRVLKVTNSLRKAPILLADERLELERVRAPAIRAIEAATAELIETLDVSIDDADLEDATGAEDAFEEHEERVGYSGPGCNVADGAEDNHDREDVDEREPEHDAEVETWSHWLDHPPELHIGNRPGWNDDPEAA